MPILPHATSRFDKRLTLVLIILGSLTALMMRFRHLAERDLWGDEIYQFGLTKGPFKFFWQRLTYGDFTSFPGDYLLTYPFVQIFGMNKWGLAIPHIAATVLGLVLLFLIARRYYRSFVGYLVAFAVVAFHSDLIFHSFEFRPYAVMPTLALASFLLADIFVTEFERLNDMQRWMMMSVFILTIWFHALGILMVVCPLLYFILDSRLWLNKKKRGDLIRWLGGMFLVALPVWAWYASGNPDRCTPASRLEVGIHPFAVTQNPFETGFGSFFNRIFLYNLIGFKKFYFLLGVMVFVMLIPQKNILQKLGYYLLIIFLPIASILTAALISNYWFLDRQYNYLSPLFAFFLGWLWDTAFSYFRDRRQSLSFRPLQWTEGLAFFMMAGCSIGGTVGMIVSR